MSVWKSFAANEVSHSEAHYLTTLHELHERRGYARVSDVARELEVTKGSVSVQMKHLKERGFVIEDENKFLRLTAEGMTKARQVLSNREILIRFFENVLGVEPRLAEIDACKMEHLVSKETCHQLLCLVHFLHSDDGTARAFLEKIKQYKMTCPSPEECGICTEACLMEADEENFGGQGPDSP